MQKYYDNDLLANIKYLIANGSYDVAEEKIEDYKLLYPKDIIVNKLYASILIKKGLFEEAEQVCMEIINGSFHSKRLKSDVYLTLSEALYGQEKYNEAIDALKKAYTLKDNNTQTIQIRLANLYMLTNNKEAAKKILDDERNNTNVFNKNVELHKALVFIKELKSDEALDILLSINDLDLKSNIDVQRKNMYLGYIYKLKSDYEKSLYYYSKALSVKNDYYWTAYHNIGYIKYKFGNIDEAIHILEETLKYKEEDVVLECLIKCYLLKGFNDKSYQLVNKINNEYTKKLYLGRIAINKQEYNEAESILSDLYNNKNYSKFVYYRYTYYYLIVSKFRLKKYNEALELINNDDRKMITTGKFVRELSLMKYYINIKLGNYIEPSNYSERQVSYYSEELAINHIKKHHDEDYKISKFSDDIDIENLLCYIKNNITDDNKIIFGMLDKYIIDFPKDIGNDNLRNLRSVSIICLPDTKDIITMYPDKYEKLIDENDINKNIINHKPKTKRLSQIEKFNKKYNL